MTITDRSRTAHVLLSIEDCRRMSGEKPSIADALAMDAYIDFDPPRAAFTVEPAELG